MGRVRKYKKFKACDPFNKQAVKKVDEGHDQPPEIFEEQTRKAANKLMKRWESSNSIERMLQHDAARFLKHEEAAPKTEKNKIEGKKEEESMKEFKTRIRNETRKSLMNEKKSKSSTALKNKKYLNDKKLKKKGIVRIDMDENTIEDGFSCREDGLLRSSDLGGSDEFAKPEQIKFGERMEAPPDFRQVGALKMKSANGITTVKKEAPRKGRNPLRGQSESTGQRQNEEDENEDERDRPKKKKRKEKGADLSSMGSGGVIDDSHGVVMSRDGTGIITSSSTARSKATTAPKTKSSVVEMDALRAKVQSAYRAMQEKKRGGPGLY